MNNISYKYFITKSIELTSGYFYNPVISKKSAAKKKYFHAYLPLLVEYLFSHFEAISSPGPGPGPGLGFSSITIP